MVNYYCIYLGICRGDRVFYRTGCLSRICCSVQLEAWFAGDGSCHFWRDLSSVNVFLTRIPLINVEMVADIANKMQNDGLLTMVNGPLRGVPYKIYAVQAGGQSLPYLSFLLMSILARLERLLPVTLLAGILGKWFRGFFEKRTALVIVAYILIWGIIYFLYYLRFC
jgi:hypothetical protein